MIWGKTYGEVVSDRHQEISRKKMWWRRFAWLPLTLKDGRTVWWQWVWSRYEQKTFGIGLRLINVLEKPK